MNYYLRNMLKQLLIPILFCLCIIECHYSDVNSNDYKKADVYKLTILHTNDHHGRFWKNRQGQSGMSARKTLVDLIRKQVVAQHGQVLLLDAGDVNTGVPESDLLDAEPDFLAMNIIGYNVMTMGNHELDNGIKIFEKQKGWADFPILSANVFDRKTGKHFCRSFVKFDLHGLKVIVVGLTTEDIAIQGNPETVAHLQFKPAVEYARTIVPILRKQTDILIALTHMGFYRNGEHGSNAPGSVSLARDVKGIDVIVDGHSHDALCQPDHQNGSIIVQAGEYGKYLGRLDLEYRNGKLFEKKYYLIPINDSQDLLQENALDCPSDSSPGCSSYPIKFQEDIKLLKFLRKYRQQGNIKLNMTIGVAGDDFNGEKHYVRNNQSPIGQLICRAAMEKTGADVAAMNSGGIRSGLKAGKIAYRDILMVSPFGNNICTIQMSGAELKDYLAVVCKKEKDTGGYAQWGGLDIRYEQERIIQVTIDKIPLVPSKIYKLVTIDYLAAGGDGYPRLDKHPKFVNTGYFDADVLKEFIQKHSPIYTSEFMP